jgi:hypothetical protein
MEILTMPVSLARSIVFAVILCSSLPALALEDTPQNREQQANRYLDAVPPQSMMAEFAAKMAQSLPQAQQDEFKALMMKYIDMPKVTAAIRGGLNKIFTADELQALADFYGSAAGRAAMAKMGEYTSEVMPATMTEIRSAVVKAQEEAGTKK